MDSDQMSKIGLVHVVGKFQKETISKEIVHKLSEYEMKILGLHKSDMMKLRNACILFGPGQLLRSNHGCGSPHFDIPKSILSNFISDGFKISYIAKLLGVSERTIYRRMQQFNLYVENFSDISDDVLFLEVGKTVKEFPFCGENMVMQLLKQRRFRVQRWRLRDALYTLDETGIQERKKGRLQRRVYNVKGPNHLWHIDTNHQLIRGHFVIVGGIDGYNRLVVTFFYSVRTIIHLLLS
jgi:hypothetical protein